MKHRNADDLRSDVASAYTAAIESAKEGKGGCCGAAEPAGFAAKLAGYSKELETHDEAGRSSFGCGNPLAFAEVRTGQTVLDLGSGAGFDLLIAADKVGSAGRVIGVDMTDAMIETARANVAKAGLRNVEVRKGLIEALPVEDGSVDWVISNCVINLSPEKERVFREIRRVLKPGGRFSISDIVAEDLPQWILGHMAAYASCVAGAISEQAYVAGLESAGLVDVEVSGRVTYDTEQIRGLVESDLASLGADVASLGPVLPDLEGKVRSIRVSGKRPGGAGANPGAPTS